MKKMATPALWPPAVRFYPICLLSLLLGGSVPARTQFTQQSLMPVGATAPGANKAASSSV